MLKEFNYPTEVIPSRTETGFLFSPINLEKVQRTLESLGYIHHHHDNPYTQSIYFASPSGQTVPGGYIRLRNYVPDPSCINFNITPNSKWLLEGKVDGKPKERIPIYSQEALEILAKPSSREKLKSTLPLVYKMLECSEPMFPVVATQWLRKHYVLDSTNRATIDSTLIYFAFTPPSLTAPFMAQGLNCKIEWKNLDGCVPVDQFQDVNLNPIPPKWHEVTIRKMYIEWLLKQQKNNDC